MKNSPELTTALAFFAAMCSNNKNFEELPCGYKKVIFEIYRWWTQEQEFSERFTETIIVPWCYQEV